MDDAAGCCCVEVVDGFVAYVVVVVLLELVLLKFEVVEFRLLELFVVLVLLL